jgi:hypothetical protein
MMNAHVSRYKNFALVVMCFISVDSCTVDHERINAVAWSMVIGLAGSMGAGFGWYLWRQPSDKEVTMEQARAKNTKYNLKMKELEVTYQMARLQEEKRKTEAETAKIQQASEQKKDEIALSMQDKKTQQLIITDNILNNQIRKNETTYLVRNQAREHIEWYKQQLHACREEESEDHRRCREFEKNLNTEIGLARYYEEELMKEKQQSNTITFENNHIVIGR